IFYLFSQSPSPDLPVIIFSLVLLEELLNKQNSPLLFAFSVFVFCIKPTMLWLPIFSFVHLCFYNKGGKWRSIIFGIAILFLFFIKNIWTFGYPVFPVQVLDLSFGWKPNPEFLKVSSETAIQKTYDMQYSLTEIQNFSFSEMMINWLFLDGIKSFIHILFVLFLLVFTIFTFIKKEKIITILYISILLKTILVLVFSAQYRFFIDVFFVVVFVMFFKGFSQKKAISFFTILCIPILGCLSFPEFLQKQIPSFRVGSFMYGFDKKQFYKPSFFQLNQYKTHTIGNLEFNVPIGYPVGFDIPQPAISPYFMGENYKLGIFPQKVGEDIHNGLIWKKLSQEDQQKLQTILSEIKASEKLSQ
ncbi:MAG: hypothetical protein Q4G16_12335, partial [Cruoricaptor ignavus]|nr:hypothetical protein [Cruoricaptor ignavus]